MPEMVVRVRWPDDTVQDCYSPSLVMHDHLIAGRSYPIDDFVVRSTTALAEASDRVRAKFGFACTSAAATTEQILRAAGRFRNNELVSVVAMEPPLPVEESR